MVLATAGAKLNAKRTMVMKHCIGLQRRSCDEEKLCDWGSMVEYIRGKSIICDIDGVCPFRCPLWIIVDLTLIGPRAQLSTIQIVKKSWG
uniref:Uncharacterized protein n=1 Tax=Tanacetum cinerariifolium TaxID=118510 RepID=A0A699L2E3_TANCI|nr:hypothetical protein [Tanacetum cinerariifolium]